MPTHCALHAAEVQQLALYLQVSTYQVTRLLDLLNRTLTNHHKSVCRRSSGLYIAPCALNTNPTGFRLLRVWNSVQNVIRARGTVMTTVPTNLMNDILSYIVEEVYVGTRMMPKELMIESVIGDPAVVSVMSIAKDISPTFARPTPNGSTLIFHKLRCLSVSQHASHRDVLSLPSP